MKIKINSSFKVFPFLEAKNTGSLKLSGSQNRSDKCDRVGELFRRNGRVTEDGGLDVERRVGLVQDHPEVRCLVGTQVENVEVHF